MKIEIEFKTVEGLKQELLDLLSGLGGKAKKETKDVPLHQEVAPAPVVDTPVAAHVAAPVPVAAPVAVPVVSSEGLPFSDPKTLMDWVMATYTTLGPEKGAKIQDVLNAIGCPNVSDVKPENYAALYAGVKAL